MVELRIILNNFGLTIVKHGLCNLQWNALNFYMIELWLNHDESITNPILKKFCRIMKLTKNTILRKNHDKIYFKDEPYVIMIFFID